MASLEHKVEKTQEVKPSSSQLNMNNPPERRVAIKALCRAAQAGDIEEINEWLALDASLIDGNPDDKSVPIFSSLRAPNSEAFNHLLSRNARTDPLSYGYNLAERIALYCTWSLSQKNEALDVLAAKGVALHPVFSKALKGESKALKDEAGLLPAEVLSAKDGMGNNLAHYASANNQLDLLQRLISQQPELVVTVNNDRMAPLLQAAWNGQLAVVEWLLCEGDATVSERDNKGVTALLLAAYKGQLAVVQWLLREGGAIVSERNNYGDTALLMAAYKGQLAVVEWLLGKGGATVSERNNNGNTALLWAAYNGHLTVVKWLLREGGATVSEQDKDGNTALLYAAGNGHVAVVEWLIRDYGVNPGDGHEIARRLKENSPQAQAQEATRLNALLHTYQQNHYRSMCAYPVKIGLPDGFLKDLTNIIEEYMIPHVDDKDTPGLFQQAQKYNENLLQELKGHGGWWGFFTLSSQEQRLTKEVIAKISAQPPCTPFVIPEVIKKFLAAHEKELAGTQLLNILHKILQQTSDFDPTAEPSVLLSSDKKASASSGHTSNTNPSATVREIGLFASSPRQTSTSASWSSSEHPKLDETTSDQGSPSPGGLG